MKKTAIAAALLMATGSAQAAFLQAGSTGTIEVTSACFTFGICSVDGSGPDDVTDNGLSVTTGTGTVGSSIAGDGLVGVINFTVGADGNTISITSFNMDAYTGTAGGTFATQMTDTSAAGGFIDDAGNITLDFTGRTGAAEFYAFSLGEQPWNLDTHSGTGNTAAIGTGTGLYVPFTTGTVNVVNGATGAPVGSVSGSALVAAGAGAWTGTVVSGGNVGDSFGFFDGNPYSEIYNFTLTGTAVPVPAAVWLFGSGLIGLAGVARRRKAS